MALEPFMQGPMTEQEATDLANKYKASGRRVAITASFQPGLKYVQVYLPVSRFRPRQSAIYQQKIWK